MLRNARTIAAGAGAVLMLGGLVALAGPASAAQTDRPAEHRTTETLQSPGDFTATGVNIRTGPTLGNTIVGQGNPGDGLTFLSGVVAGDAVRCPSGSVVAQWFLIRNHATGVEGYANGCFITAH